MQSVVYFHAHARSGTTDIVLPDVVFDTLLAAAPSNIRSILAVSVCVVCVCVCCVCMFMYVCVCLCVSLIV